MSNEQAVYLALSYLDTGRPERALEELAPLLASHPDEPELLVLGAQAAAMVGDLASARDMAGRAVALAPDDVTALLVQSQVDIASGRSIEAAKAAAAAVRAAPGDWRTHAQVVRVDLGAGRIYSTAADASTAMLRLAPDRPEAHALAGHLAAARRRRRSAEEHFRAALAIDPMFGGAQEGLARLAAGRLRFGPALETASSRLAADPTDRVGKRLLDAMTTRLVAPALLGPPIVVFGVWRATSPSQYMPEWEAGSRTLIGDYPAALLLPAALVMWVVVQSVLLHRASAGEVWRDVLELPARGWAMLLLAVGVLSIGSLVALSSAPIGIVRPVLLVESLAAAFVIFIAFVASGMSHGRLRGRVDPSTGTVPVELRSRVIAATALLVGPVAAGAALGTAGRAVGGSLLGPGEILLQTHPWTGGAVALVVAGAAAALLAAHRLSGGSIWRSIRHSRWFGALLAAAVVDALSVATTVGALLQPARLGGFLIAALAVGWMLAGLVVALVHLRRQRLARR